MVSTRIQNGLDVSGGSAATMDRAGVVSWVQRALKRLPGQRLQKKSLRHIETLSLGTKRAVFLIECDGQRFLVADGMSAPVPLMQRFAAEEQC
jgi:hypothetical protein